MKTIKTILNNIFPLIAIIFVILFIQKSCNPEQPEIIIKKDTVLKVIFRDYLKVDTVIQNKYITKNVHDTIIVIVHDSIYIASEIISDWFAIKFIPDTVFNSDSLLLVINDSLYQNTIKNRRIDYKAINTTNIYTDSKMHLYIGANSYINTDIELSLNAYLKKNKHLFNVGINNNKQIIAGYAFKIK